ncbi:MAG TPA: methionyl-tRNA formyltransferase, partial [Polyangiaceae bacterium]|nr:methionyl-tRNA formyltransferase [Polyangiaceae bacterium]
MTFRALFFGSPAFAVPSLDALHALGQVVGVVSQPDKPAGRGLALTAPAVKVRATELGLPVVQPTKLRTGEFGAWVRDQAVDVALVVAYGRILPKDVLDGPRLGCVNVHASLLPKYRGAAPITWTVVHGETESGVTLMKLDEGMDTGPTFARVVTPVGAEETAGELSERLARVGADAVTEWLPRYLAGECPLVPQDAGRATTAPMLAKDRGRIEWSKTARQVHDHVRGMSPWPGAFTSARGKALKVHATRVVDGTAVGAAPGQVVVADK